MLDLEAHEHTANTCFVKELVYPTYLRKQIGLNLILPKCLDVSQTSRISDDIHFHHEKS